MFDDKTKFANFFRTIPSDDTLLLGIGTALEYYGWTRVALITQMENIFLSVSTENSASAFMHAEAQCDLPYLVLYTGMAWVCKAIDCVVYIAIVRLARLIDCCQEYSSNHNANNKITVKFYSCFVKNQ